MRRASLLALALVGLMTNAALAQPAQPDQASVSQTDVELLEAGASPQRPLRHRFEAGQRAQYRLRIDTQVRVQAGSRNQAVDMPVMVLDVDVGPSRVRRGHLRFPFRMVAMDLDGGDERARAPLEEQLEGLVGTGGTVEFDERGRMVEFDYELPDSASPETRARAATMRESLGQLLPRFPREPVGLGAQWRIRDQLQMPGMSVQIATVYRLRRWEGDRIELQVRIESGREPATQAMQMNVEGSGRQRFVLGTLQTRSRQRSEAQVAAQGPNGQLRIEMRSHNEVEPRR